MNSGNITRIAALLVLLAAVGGALYLMLSGTGAPVVVLNQTSIGPIILGPETPQAIRVEGSEGPFTLYPAENSLSLLGTAAAERVPADETALKKMLAALRRFSPKLASDSALAESDLAAFGLSPARLKLTLLYANRSFEVSFGDAHPFGHLRYLTVAGDNRIWGVDEKEFEPLKMNHAGYRNARPLKFEVKRATVIEVETRERSFRLAANPDGSWGLNWASGSYPADSDVIKTTGKAVSELKVLGYLDRDLDWGKSDLKLRFVERPQASTETDSNALQEHQNLLEISVAALPQLKCAETPGCEPAASILEGELNTSNFLAVNRAGTSTAYLVSAQGVLSDFLKSPLYFHSRTPFAPLDPSAVKELNVEFKCGHEKRKISLEQDKLEKDAASFLSAFRALRVLEFTGLEGRQIFADPELRIDIKSGDSRSKLEAALPEAAKRNAAGLPGEVPFPGSVTLANGRSYGVLFSKSSLAELCNESARLALK